MRFCAPAIALRDAVRAGVVGAPLAVMATNPGRYPGGWFGDPALAGGGAVMDHTVHVADLLRWIFEREVTSVYAEIGTRIHPGPANGRCRPALARPRGWALGQPRRELVARRDLADLGRADDGRHRREWRPGDGRLKQNLQFFDDRAGRYGLVPCGAGGDLPLVRAFFDAVRHDTAPPVTGEDGLRALEVALCAYESARRHAPVVCPGDLPG